MGRCQQISDYDILFIKGGSLFDKSNRPLPFVSQENRGRGGAEPPLCIPPPPPLISNVFNTQAYHLLKLFEFNISWDMHPSPINVSHSWVVPHLDLPKSKIWHIHDNMHDWPHLRDIKIPTNNYDVTVFIGADMPQLHLQEDKRLQWEMVIVMK